MSLCNENRTNSGIIKSLSKRAKPTKRSCLNNGTPLCVWPKGSFTLEATIVIPIVAGFLVFLLFFFRVLQVETAVYQSISYAGRKTAASVVVADSAGGELALAKVHMVSQLKNYACVEDYVFGGVAGVTILNSDTSGNYIDLVAEYYVPFPIGFFQFKGIHLIQESKHRKWTGTKELGDVEEGWVYITPQGEAYHSTSACRYLDLSISATESSKINGLRNFEGHKYSACAWCVAKNRSAKTVYITNYGELYHTNLQCPSLKRTLQYVRLSEVGGRHGCAKCVKAGG